MNQDRIFALIGTAFLFGLLATLNTSLVPPAVAFGELNLASEIAFSEYNTVVFVGDIMLARHVEFLQTSRGVDYPFSGMQELLSKENDSAVVANFEASVPDVHVPTPHFTTRFSVPRDRVSSLQSLGITHLSLANNHSYDFGRVGYANTVASIQGNGMYSFGHPENVAFGDIPLLRIGDTTMALVGLHVLEKEIDVVSLAAIQEDLEQITDLQVVYIHWGNEYELVHSSKQREQAEVLVELGFDLIVGHHPHVVQDIELIEDVPVVYSLGNFIFDQYFSREVQTGLLLELNTVNAGLELQLTGIESYSSISQPRAMKQNANISFLAAVAARSDDRLGSMLEDGVLTLPLR